MKKLILILTLIFITNFYSYSAGGYELRYNIISLREKSTLSGSFFLGSGALNNIACYYTYIELSPKNYRLFICDATRTIIHEGTKDPYIIIKVGAGGWLAKDILEKSLSIGNYCDLYVPINTIIREFKL